MPAADLLGSLARAVTGAQGMAGGAAGRVWDELRPWLTRLAVNAGPKWVPVLALGVPCQVPVYQGGRPVAPCTCRAIGPCSVCDRTCCLNHAAIDQHGDAICYLCVSAARHAAHSAAESAGQQEPPPASEGPSAEDLRWARRKLGVSKAASWDEIRAAYRAKLKQHHPDRQRSEAARAAAEEKFKEIRRAYDLLERQQGSQGSCAA